MRGVTTRCISTKASANEMISQKICVARSKSRAAAATRAVTSGKTGVEMVIPIRLRLSFSSDVLVMSCPVLLTCSSLSVLCPGAKSISPPRAAKSEYEEQKQNNNQREKCDGFRQGKAENTDAENIVTG